MRKSGDLLFAKIPRLKFLESITFHDFGSTGSKIIAIQPSRGSSLEIIVLDNGLISKGEHSYNLSVKLTEKLTQRKLPFRIFGSQRMSPAIVEELGAHPHFSRSLYDSLDDRLDLSRLEKRWHAAVNLFHRSRLLHPPRSERRSWRALNQSFAEDLANLPPDVWGIDNLIVIPAISQNQIFGLVRCLKGQSKNKLPRILCGLMFPPFWTPWGGLARHGERYYRDAFRQAAPFLDRVLTFTVENRAMRELFKDLYGIEPEILPIPFEAAPRKAKSVGPLRVGFFGYSKCDKGFHLLPEAIALCRSQGVQAEFIIQIQHHQWEPRVIEAEGTLRGLAGVKFLTGVLSAHDFANWTGQADIILLPYDPIAFGAARGSGIFIESVAAGCPIIASKDTFAGTSVENEEAEGEVFAPYTSEALAAAIARLIRRWPRCSERAAAKALAFARRHNGEFYTDLLLKLGARL